MATNQTRDKVADRGREEPDAHHLPDVAARREALREFAKAWHVPVCVSFRRHDVFPNSHELFVGDLGLANAMLHRPYEAEGVILGGRLGYVLFYKPAFFLQNPAQILTLWEGGMSFHGGLLGTIVAMVAFSMRNGISPFLLSDLVSLVIPIGLFFGRLANFINGELWGRVSDAPWAMVFPRGGPLPRHPSQLYQATFEGILLLALVLAVWKFTDGRRRPGLITGAFCIGYGIARITGETFREPDSFLGFLLGDWLTMGMLLSLPMILFGAWVVARALRRPALA